MSSHVHGPNCSHGPETAAPTPEQLQLLAQQQQQMTDLRSEPYKKIALELAQFLRHNAMLKNKSGALDGKRVEYFKGTSFRRSRRQGGLTRHRKGMSQGSTV